MVRNDTFQRSGPERASACHFESICSSRCSSVLSLLWPLTLLVASSVSNFIGLCPVPRYQIEKNLSTSAEVPGIFTRCFLFGPSRELAFDVLNEQWSLVEGHVYSDSIRSNMIEHVLHRILNAIPCRDRCQAPAHPCEDFCTVKSFRPLFRFPCKRSAKSRISWCSSVHRSSPSLTSLRILAQHLLGWILLAGSDLSTQFSVDTGDFKWSNLSSFRSQHEFVAQLKLRLCEVQPKQSRIHLKEFSNISTLVDEIFRKGNSWLSFINSFFKV